jgi:hypothetical protein
MAGQQSVATPRYVYLVGSQAGWAEPSADNADTYNEWRLADKSESGIYTGTFDISAQDLYFRVYPELTGWGSTPYSAAADGSNVDLTFGTAAGYVEGEGCWVVPGWAGGKLTFTLDTNNGTMTVVSAE